MLAGGGEHLCFVLGALNLSILELLRPLSRGARPERLVLMKHRAYLR
jgi:hypothetical protein